ncbi:MAG TPA: TetR/AcrR family transcriptional regulator [Burkholderiales bacterium]|nr:TetR/AcrR family transcriptional regulator [Burkholderiales bacterium]
MPPARPARVPRADNRLPLILDEAARLFAVQGFHGTSVRDIVRAIDMLPGSLYYHFATKEALLAAVYAEGVRRISEAVSAAIAGKREPWERLEAACVAHLEGLLLSENSAGDYAQVVIRVRPADAPTVAGELVRRRDEYERLFVDLVQALPLARGVDRRSVRLMLLGALNWSQTWYHPGRDSPRTIARRFVALLRSELDQE